MTHTNPTQPARLYKPYLCFVVTAGAAAFVYSCLKLDYQAIDAQMAIIVLLTLLLSSRIILPIPRFSSQISVSDTFIFLALLLYGGHTAVILAGAEAYVSSARFSQKRSTRFFNWGCAALSAFITSQALQMWFGDIVSLQRGPLTGSLLLATGVMALLYYATNSGMVAACGAMKAGKPLWSTWLDHYLWTSITFFAGASAATLIAELIEHVGFYSVIISVPIIATIFFTYRTYLTNIESSANQAEQAERHVQELSHYIAEQERIREQFSQMEKLSALGELASGVAHDFNNTLAGILGRAQLLLRTEDPEKVRRGLNIIIKSAEDGAKTVKRIQDFARQRKDHDFEPICVDQLLLDVSEITRPRWKDLAEASNIQITIDLKIRTQQKVMGDDSELREVLINMIFNAVDAMPKGGRLTLAAEDDGDSVAISVTDSGVGMDQEVRSRVFDPFFTTKGKAGLGLGLAVSFGIIRRHQGTIEVNSELNKGSTFCIKLPIAPEAALAETTAVRGCDIVGDTITNEIASSRSNQLAVLVVDDEQTVRDLMRDVLELQDCRVYLAEGGREALALYEARKFDGVFTDVGMPGMSGWELAQEIRRRDEKIPIAVVTGWGEAVGSSEQKQAGVNWVVSKPFTMERLAELADEMRRNRDAAIARDAFAIVAA